MTARTRIALLALVTALLGGVATRVRVSADLAEALPKEGEAGRAFADISRFSLLDSIVIEVDGTGVSEQALHDAVDQLGAKLTARGDFASVRYRFGMADGIALRTAAAPSLALLGDSAGFAARLSPEGMTSALSRARDRMLSPAGAMMSRGLESDPLDFGGAFTDAVMGVGALGGVSLRDGHLVADDSHHALILARANTPALGTTLDSPIVTHLQEDLAASVLPATWLGSHRFAAEAADQITREVNRAVTAGLLLVGLTFLVAFRSVRPLLGALPALIVGGAAAAAAAALRSPIHGMALAFGGALAGLGVDYWIHLYLTGIRDGVPATAKERFETGLRALHHLLPAYAMSVAATLTAFLMLATSSYQAVADLAWIGIGTASGALLSVVLGGPTMFALVARPGDRVPRLPLPTRIPGAFAAMLVVGVGVLGFAGLGVHFDGDPRAMDARLPETAAIERTFESRYGGSGTTALIVAEAPTLDAALDQLARAVAGLANTPGITVKSPLPYLPAPSERVARAALLADPAALEARFLAAADAVGFSGDALLPGFRATLAASAAPTVATWAGTPGADLVDRTVRIGPDGAAVAAIVNAVTTGALEYARREVELSGGEARFVFPSAIAKDGAERIRGELLTRSGLGLLAVLVFMAIRYRDVPKFVAAALPSVAAAAGTLGVLALTEHALTPVSGPALVLVLGLAFDQGVFLVEADQVSPDASGKRAWLASRAAILVALCTALGGFVGLTVATHPAVFGVGVAMSLGITLTFGAAFLIVPAVLTDEGREFTRRLSRRAVFVLAVALSLDALLALRGRVVPPPAPTSFRTYQLDVRSPTDRRYGPNRLTRSHGVWVARAEGTPYEIGYATGLLAGDLRARNEASIVEEFYANVTNPLLRYALVRGVPLLADTMSGSTPVAYLEELRGYTDTGEDHMGWVSPEYTRKLCYHAIHDVGQAMVDSPLLGCTGFLAGGARTADGHWIIGRNWDFDGGRLFDEDKSVVLVKRDGAIPFLHVAIVGLSGVVSGVNAEGIAVAVLAGASDAPIKAGAPMIFIVREILEQARSLDEARAILDARRGFVSEGLLIVDGKRGEGAVFEVTPEEVQVLPAGESIALANHFRSASLADDVANQQRMAEGTTVARLARMEALIAPELGPIDLDRALAILRDRGGVDSAALPAGHESAINADVASHGVVIDATARTITVSMAPNLSGGFVRFALDDVLAGNLDGERVAGPDAPEVTYRVHEARRLRERAGHLSPGAAEPLLRQALRLAPGAPETLLALAEVLVALDQGPEARTLVDQAVATPPARAKDLRKAEAIGALAAEVAP
jgi:isopenicillin-N N-acyltransferase-like protein